MDIESAESNLVVSDKQSIIPNDRMLQFWIPAYALGIATLYQSVYWSHFSVNVFAYLGIQDILKITLIPVALLLLATIVLGHFPFYESGFVRDRLSEDQAGWKRKPRHLKRLHMMLILIGVFALMAGCFAILMAFKDSGLMPVGALIALTVGVLGVFFITSSKLQVFSSIPLKRNIKIMALVATPLITVILASQTASKVQEGLIFTSASFELTGNDSAKRPISTIGLKYLGHINEYDFFLDKETTLVIQSERIEHLALKAEYKEMRIIISIPFTNIAFAINVQ